MGAGRGQSALKAWPASERRAVMKEQALFGNPITTCKVPLRAPGESQTETNQEPEGDSSHCTQEQMAALERLAWDRMRRSGVTGRCVGMGRVGRP